MLDNSHLVFCSPIDVTKRALLTYFKRFFSKYYALCSEFSFSINFSGSLFLAPTTTERGRPNDGERSLWGQKGRHRLHEWRVRSGRIYILEMKLIWIIFIFFRDLKNKSKTKKSFSIRGCSRNDKSFRFMTIWQPDNSKCLNFILVWVFGWQNSHGHKRQIFVDKMGEFSWIVKSDTIDKQ